MNAVLPPFQSFLDHAVHTLQSHAEAIGLAVGGSYVSGDMDRYSDLDLVLITEKPIAPDVNRMREWAARLGPVLASFRGDHVGEPRLLITLYDAPLLHVDIKFLTLAEFQERVEFGQRVENPVVVWERDGALTAVIRQSTAHYPSFDFQWAEDRFWVWVHYALLKIGRGEYLEALDFLAFLRGTVLGPMLHLRNGHLPRGVRRIETAVGADELARLQTTVATPAFLPLMNSLVAAVRLYEDLRQALAPVSLQKRDEARRAVWAYYDQILRIHSS